MPEGIPLRTIEDELMTEVIDRLQPHVDGEASPGIHGYNLYSYGSNASGVYIYPSNPAEAPELIEALRDDILDGLPGSKAFVSRASLLNIGISGGRNINIDLQGPELGPLMDAARAGQQAIADVGAGPRDSVVGIAASGRTPYVIGALKEARRRGALTLALVCNLPAPLAQGVDHLIAPLVGPEVLAGSTRLKAGTAQKLVLNMLSTGVMVRLGKTHGNLMVDLRQQSAKLQDRARRIVAQACDISEAEAGAALASSQGHVKVAIVSTLLGCTAEVARERLAQTDGQVRAAVAGEDSLSLVS